MPYERNENSLGNYDTWKMRSPDDEHYQMYSFIYYDDEPDYDYCCECSGTGWIVDDNDIVCPCSECMMEVILDDLLDMYCEEFKRS